MAGALGLIHVGMLWPFGVSAMKRPLDFERRLMILLSGHLRVAVREHPNWFIVDRAMVTKALAGLDMDELYRKHDGCHREDELSYEERHP